MDYRKILGIIFIILGLLFVIYPLYSAEAVSWIAGICLIDQHIAWNLCNTPWIIIYL